MSRPAILPTEISRILAAEHLVTVPELSQYLTAKSGKAFNKTSLYRALEKMEAAGQVCRHVLTEGEVRYELRDHHHDHVVCTSCGVIVQIDCQVHPPVEVADFQIDHHHLTLYGRCPDCSTVVHKKKQE